MIDTSVIRRLSDIARVQAIQRPQAVAIVQDGHAATFEALERASNQVAHALLNEGVAPGDRVCILAKNSSRFFELFFGAAKARACLTPINVRLAGPEIAYILADSKARLLFVGEEFFEIAERIVAASEAPVKVIALAGAPASAPGFESWRSGHSDADPALPERDDDDVLQLYTSGTTGHPKGVMLSNANYSQAMAIVGRVEGFDYQPDDAVLVVMPLFHVAGFNASAFTLASGGRVILLADFSPDGVLETIERSSVAYTLLAPAMILMLLQSARLPQTDVSTLKVISYGAAPISEDVLNRAKTAFGCGFAQFYGMTETLGAGAHLAPSDHALPGKLRSCGRALEGIEVAVFGSDGARTPIGEVGEIAIKGGVLMKGYWNRPEATAATIRDGWLFTGDAGIQDDDGFFYIHDRMKDMIISGGENVYPAEVENAIFGAPGVADVAVIGVPSERWGEEVKAIVVAEPGTAPDPAAIIAWARERIAGYKAPRSIDFIDVLPRNASGKVLRKDLREQYWAGLDRRIS